MRLLALDGDAVSLEFDPAERAVVRDRLRGFGPVSVVRDVTFDRIRVGGEELIWLDEWDEPCLISQTSEGSRLLRSLAAGSDERRLAAG